MLTQSEKIRYNRHLILPEIGTEGQIKLKNSSVLVIGAGGLGCPVLQYLAAAGVGNIGIIDFDKIDESNLQRQVLYNFNELGKLKAEVAACKLDQLNPYINIDCFPEKLTTGNAFDLFADYDLIIDGSDNFETRYLVNDASVLTDKPLVYGSIFRFEGQVSVFNYKNNDGNTGPTYRCLFPAPPNPESAPNCSQAGVIGVLPGIIGTLQANEAIKIITGAGKVLSGELLLIDALNLRFSTVQFERNDKAVEELKKKGLDTFYEFSCSSSSENSVKNITVKEMIAKPGSFQIIDIREEYEEPACTELAALKIPMGQLSENLDLLNNGKKILLMCQSGKRSSAAALNLSKIGLNNVYNLSGGILAYLDEMKQVTN